MAEAAAGSRSGLALGLLLGKNMGAAVGRPIAGKKSGENRAVRFRNVRLQWRASKTSRAVFCAWLD